MDDTKDPSIESSINAAVRCLQEDMFNHRQVLIACKAVELELRAKICGIDTSAREFKERIQALIW